MRVIRASEIGEYVFCHRAWWLRQVQGETSTNTSELADGTAHHARHGRQVSLAGALRTLAVLLLLAALVALVLAYAHLPTG
jgi:CRISPR/Cas system-associated exonuclease Cas4 (RecB family)